MKFKITAIGFGVLTLASSSFAQLVNVGPFVGTHSDGFENDADYNVSGGTNFLQSSDGFFSYSSDPSNQNSLYVYNPTGGATFGLDNNGTATTNSGDQALGLFLDGTNSPVVTINFATPVDEFGGYFASDSITGHFYATFFDQNGKFLQQTDLYAATNTMTWSGWQGMGGELIGYVQLSGNIAPVMDDLQASPAPEPMSIAFLGLGALGLLKRRKK